MYMKFALLVEAEMEPIPYNIMIKFDAGPTIVIISEDGKPVDIKEGRHVSIEGPQEDIVKWLKPFDGVMKTVGPMQLEQFEVVHIK